METCQCGDPEALGTHWYAEDGECCPPGCDCQDCLYWAPFPSIDVSNMEVTKIPPLEIRNADENDSD